MALLHHQWVPVHTGHQAQTDSPPYGFGNLPLVLRSQTRLLGVLYPARLGHEFRHHGEVLVLVDGVDAEHIESVALGPLAAKLPLLLLESRQVVGRIHITRLPLAEDLALVLVSPLRLDYLTRLGRAVEAGIAGETSCERIAARSLLLGCRAACGAAATEDGQESVILLLGAGREAS